MAALWALAVAGVLLAAIGNCDQRHGAAGEQALRVERAERVVAEHAGQLERARREATATGMALLGTTRRAPTAERPRRSCRAAERWEATMRQAGRRPQRSERSGR